MDKQEILRFINSNPNMQLATVDDAGQPHTRGMAMYSADESGIVFHTGTFKDVYKELKSSPMVEMSFFNPQDFVQVRVQGQAEEIMDQDFKEKIVNTPGREFLKPWIEQNGYGMMAVFKIVCCRATTWTMATNFEYPKGEVHL